MPSMDSTVISVSQLTAQIKEQLETCFPYLEVRGEVSNFKRQSSGHLYFSIKDAASQVSCVMFRGKATTLKRLPQDGDQVIISGSINVYAPRGSYQLMASSLRFSGTGDLLLLIEQLKKKLSDMGWFDGENKLTFPLLPQKIALITSPTGSVLRDILHVLQRRHPGFKVLICPVRVQGEEAPREIVGALETVNRFELADAIILARGGGSIEDLMPFNDEKVLKAIFESRIPIMSGVGHETDTTLSDLVADQRAPTPSAAAELILGEKRQMLLDLSQIRDSMLKPLRAHFKSQRQMLSALHRHPWLSDPLKALGPHWQRLDDLQEQLSMIARSKLGNQRLNLQRLKSTLMHLNPRQLLEKRRIELKRIDQLIHSTTKASVQTRQELFSQSKRRLDQAGPTIKARFLAKLNSLAALPRLHQMWQAQKNQRTCRLKQLQDLFLAKDPHELIKRGYAIVYSQKGFEKGNRVPITTIRAAEQQMHLMLQLSDGSVSVTTEKSSSHRLWATKEPFF